MSLPPPPQRGRQSPPVLVDDALGEIFLRIPPDDPKSLVRAAAVCTTWRGILSDAAFDRCYREFHGAPPVLGFLHNKRHERTYGKGRNKRREAYLVSNFVSTASFRPPACHERRHWHALDSRHGLALFHTPKRDEDFVVCDLVTYDRWRINAISEFRTVISNANDEDITWNAAVICAKEQCNHIYCHGGPFFVALVGSDEEKTFASFYSSVTRKWSGMISIDEPHAILMTGHSAVVGNKVYFHCEETESVVEYDMGEQELCVIDTPFESELVDLVGVEDGMLLFTTLKNSRLYLLSMVAGPDGTKEWARCRVVNLEPLLPSHALLDVSVVGFAQGLGLIFLNTEAGLFTVELASGRRKKVDGDTSFTKVMPYMSFFTKEWGRQPTSE
ncbi:uncharacterized protein LOC100843023 [Brachypodium distachyon]|uniref:F-box domain-containing protein n=1 Tax=Brachypodium distachyon TaxID=15368 RepID=A0A0Q3HKE2_BRADI|nr:uncharacterized protein LOC100843023 [Brachypodium distachyon]KQK23439.1 hypothetical protein BRADI_1g73752v3 [Brachypodium distachyon]|eukprot:XP_003562025.2 uncharacterized protein LOC100843023 [Brachypodium distachyon]